MFVGNALSQLHDAELGSLSIDRKERIVTLGFRQQGGAICHFRFNGVICFRVVDIILQNVVSRILVSGNDAFSEGQLRGWIEWANTLTDSQIFIKPPGIDDLIAGIRAGDLSLLVLEPSWGAELVIIFEKATEVPAS